MGVRVSGSCGRIGCHVGRNGVSNTSLGVSAMDLGVSATGLGLGLGISAVGGNWVVGSGL